MDDMHPRIRGALKSVHPTSDNPAHHGAPSAQAVLRGVRAAAAVWRPYPDCNNIREIALHIAIHENAVANRISGKNEALAVKMRKFGWAERLETVSEEQWQLELELVNTVHERLAAAVAHFDPDLLDQIVGKKTIIHAVDFIHGIAEHSLYHTAQMEMLKTLARQTAGIV